MSHPNFNTREGEWMLEQDQKERAYVEKRWKEQEKKKRAKKKLEHDEKTRAIVQDPHFLVMTVKEVQETEGIAGEEDTIIALILIANTRLINNASAESKNLLLSDTTGTGKDRVTKATLKVLLPDDMHFHFSKMTPEAFTYFHANEPDWTWDGKVFYLEDIPDRVLRSDVFKVMASGGSKATVLIKQKPVDFEIKGKPVMIITSYSTNPNDEILRRFPIIGLDETKGQTLEIMKRQAENAKVGDIIEYNKEITGALKLLNRVNVKIPFANKLPLFFPTNRFMRTSFLRFLDLIKASAALHQYQRKKEDGYIIATKEDYKVARRVLLKTVSNPEMVPLTRKQKDILNYFKKNEGWYSVGDISNKFPFSERTLYTQLDKLFRFCLLKKNTAKRENSSKDVKVYSYNKEELDFDIPEWDKIESANIDFSNGSISSNTSFTSNASNRGVIEAIEPIVVNEDSIILDSIPFQPSLITLDELMVKFGYHGDEDDYDSRKDYLRERCSELAEEGKIRICDNDFSEFTRHSDNPGGVAG